VYFALRTKPTIAALLLIGTLLTQTLLSQTIGGAITGTVTDQQGSVMPGAVAKFTNSETGVTTSMLANSAGTYRATNLQPGHYSLTVTLPGFAVGVQKNINLTVGAEVVIDFSLKVADVTQDVQVNGTVSEVDLASSTLSYAVTGTTIRELPLNGRDYTSLATLQPGVVSVGTSGGMRAGYGNKLSISGTRPSQNNFLFDGVSINDSGNNTPGSILGVTLGVDAVEQFTLLTDTFSAEYGRAAGGILNAITRSGTNQLHGSAFYFGRNSALDARNYFDTPGASKPEFRRHQYGASAGGPIVKDRTFWFFDYEGVRQFLGSTTISTVPSLSLRSGRYVDSKNQAINYNVDPVVAKVLNLYPLPNAGLIGNGNTGTYSTVLDKLANENYYLAKVDHKVSEKDSVRASYFIDTGTSTSPDNFKNYVSATTSRRQSISLEYTRIVSPSTVSVARAGFSRTVFQNGVVTDVLNPAISDKSLGYVPGLDIGAVAVSGLTNLAAGPTALDFSFANYNSFQYFENLYITKGAHTIKLGVNADRMQYNTSQPNLTGGQFSFGSLPGFITNGLQNTNPAITFAATFLDSNDERGMRETMLGGYIQDDWRIRKNLTLNLGLRYEFVTIPTESQNKIALLHNLQDKAPTLGGPIHDSNPTLKDFSPRVGFAWNPDGTGKMAVRAGFGVFDNLPLLYLYDTPLMRSFPYFTQGVLTNVTTPALYGSFPNKAYNLFTSGQLRTAYVDVNPPRSYSLQWNLNIQRQIKSWIATVGYVGSRGVHLVQVERNLNVVYPTLTSAGWFYPPTSTTQKLNPNFATINTTDTWNADSTYHSMHVSVSRPLSRGLQVQGSYTWSKSLDNSSSTSSVTAGTGYSSAIGSPAPLIPGINRGLSDFDIRHNGVISLLWDIPSLKVSSGLLRAASSGWEVSSIYRLQTGLPFTVVLNSDQAGQTKSDTTGASLGERPNLVLSPECKTLTNPGSVNGYIKTGCFTYPQPVTVNGITGTVLGNLSRNSLTAPGLANMDFSLIKNTKAGERLATQFRLEFFNVQNHPNFSAPAFILYDSNGGLNSNAGRITSTTTAARQIQLGLKLLF
jgi:hypothetical protein